ARAVSLVHRKPAGQSEPDVVLWKKHVSGAIEDRRLVIPDPDDFRRGESGQRVVSGDANEALSSDAPANLIALVSAALVVPKNGRSQDLTSFIEQDEPVHLTGQTDGCDVLSGGSRFEDRLADARGYCEPPVLGMLL